MYFDRHQITKVALVYYNLLVAALHTSVWNHFVGNALEGERPGSDKVQFPSWCQEWWKLKTQTLLGTVVKWCICPPLLFVAGTFFSIGSLIKVALWVGGLSLAIPYALLSAARYKKARGLT